MRNKIIEIAEKCDWVLIKDQENIMFLQFQSGANKINVWYGKMTVALFNPGAPTEYFYNVKNKELESLFQIGKIGPANKFVEWMNNLKKKIKK